MEFLSCHLSLSVREDEVISAAGAAARPTRGQIDVLRQFSSFPGVIENIKKSFLAILPKFDIIWPWIPSGPGVLFSAMSFDIYLYPIIKRVLKGRIFETIPEIKENTKNIFKSLKDEDFQRCFDIWKKRWNKCIDSDTKTSRPRRRRESEGRSIKAKDSARRTTTLPNPSSQSLRQGNGALPSVKHMCSWLGYDILKF
ncbi:hypothetical protein LAZ67_15001425 [Cordylochernes scorpioides]|uniref:Uncharacterized protein n=1 Tax=Cordylochernes scorpioides TaxID=51811 RepID=A0ABY6LAS5_9ARAC|nr:hypothetical protein LAZ67_15001425 [Cordylochernes scorpioides]